MKDVVISRQAAIDALAKILPTDPMKNEYTKGNTVGVALALKCVMQLPSAQSTYTNEQIQKMQDMHQAEVEKAFELGREDANAEIVRCKNCKYCHEEDEFEHWCYGFGFCSPARLVREEDFCSYGKARD